MALAIDLDRGVEYRAIGQHGPSIYMYADDPGTYLDAHGVPVSDELAAAAGFDVKKHRLLKARTAKIAEAKAAIDEQYRAMLADIDGVEDVVELGDVQGDNKNPHAHDKDHK
jgi:hypothetical protein